MPSRIDYYDDPAAPAANSRVPAVNVIVTDNGDEQDRVKLVGATYTSGNASLPGNRAT